MRKSAKFVTVGLCVAGMAGLGIGAASASATGTGHAPRAAKATMRGLAPVNAAMVTSSFGWVMTPDKFLVSRNGGASFSPVMAPVPSSYARNALFTSASRGLVAAAVGDRLTVARTVNGGRTWKVSHAVDRSLYPGAAFWSLSIAQHGSSDAILAQLETGVSFSVGTLFTSVNKGADWSARRAPVAGTVAFDSAGTLWLAGGVNDKQLYHSASLGAAWTRSTVTVAPGQQLGAVTTPVNGVVAATALLPNGTTQTDTLKPSRGERHWTVAGVTTLRGKTGFGVPPTIAAMPRGLMLFDNAGTRAYEAVGATARPMAVSASGLPEGTTAVTFARGGTHAWALATFGRCLEFKSDCTLYHQIAATDNGGTTWHQIALWTLKVG